MTQKVIILRGAPASGKTTLAKSYRNFDKKVAWLKVDNFKDFFAEDATSALEFVNGSASATLEYLLNQGFSVVVDGIFQDTRAIDEMLSIANRKSIAVKVFELSVSLETLNQRDNQREGVPEGLRKPLGADAITQIYSTLKSNSYPNSIQLDTEHNSIDKCKIIIDKTFETENINNL